MKKKGKKKTISPSISISLTTIEKLEKMSEDLELSKSCIVDIAMFMFYQQKQEKQEKQEKEDLYETQVKL